MSSPSRFFIQIQRSRYKDEELIKSYNRFIKSYESFDKKMTLSKSFYTTYDGLFMDVINEMEYRGLAYE